jgi:hypothetical protein
MGQALKFLQLAGATDPSRDLKGKDRHAELLKDYEQDSDETDFTQRR